MRSERIARWLVIGLLLGLLLTVLLSRWMGTTNQGIEIHARMPESGGWSPTDLKATVGEPLRLRLVSDDVLHGFAIGQSDDPAIDLPAGKVVETTLTFDRPGKYTFYCTRWCGPNHWRMRGTIEVSISPGVETPAEPGDEVNSPLYMILGLDIDAPHPAANIPGVRPSAMRGANNADVPSAYLTEEYYRTHSPAELWGDLRASESTQNLTNQQVWDLVAFVWQSNTGSEKLVLGRERYAQNCAACHGENGAGDGVMVGALQIQPTPVGEHVQAPDGRSLTAPADFTDMTAMLGASPALLQGKIIRGGMGTGMPYWGPIFTEDQTWTLVNYLWTFQFDYETEIEP